MNTIGFTMMKPARGAEPRLRGYSVELRDLTRSLQSEIQRPMPLGLDQAGRISYLVEQGELRAVSNELMHLLILSDALERRARGGTLTRAELKTVYDASATLARKLDIRIGERKRKRQVQRKHGSSGLTDNYSDMMDQIIGTLFNKLRQLMEALMKSLSLIEDTHIPRGALP